MGGVSAPLAPPPERARRVDGSMSLLVDVMTNTLDEAYAERAARKAGAAGLSPERPGGAYGTGARVVGGLVLVGLGLLTGIAVDQVRERAATSAGLRADLAAQVAERSAESDRLAARAEALQLEVAATRDEALGADAAGRAATEALRALEIAAATTPVSGPGVVLTVNDAPVDEDSDGSSEPRGGTAAEDRVLDRDLQDIVNGLWAAGAEAVAVNGVRLSTRAAIRSAGEAVLVDFRPISPPYVIEAIGSPEDLEVDFLDGPSGRRLQTLSSFTGITWSLERDDRLELPAATEPQLRSAEPVGAPS